MVLNTGKLPQHSKLEIEGVFVFSCEETYGHLLASSLMEVVLDHSFPVFT